MGKCFITVCILIALEAIVPTCIAATDEYEATARAFAYKQLQDPNTYSPYPPSDINPYKKMSQEQIEQIQKRAFTKGSTLQFHLNGVPALFTSRARYKRHGLEKAWYDNGRVKYEEHYNHEELLDGIYFDQTGTKLGEVKKGTGIKIIFGRPHEMEGHMLGSAEYKDGKKHGVEMVYRNYEKKIKSRERQYKEGILHGKTTGWNSNGQKNYVEHYKDGVKHGKSINWDQNGNLRYNLEYEDGKTIASTHYYKTGIKSHEQLGNEEKKWFPSGQLMLHTMTDRDKKSISGRSFDLLGNENGKVVNGIGSLIEADTDELRSWKPRIHRLRIYENEWDRRPRSLPTVITESMDYNLGSPEFDIKFKVRRTPNWGGGTVIILLPDGCSSVDKLQFTIDNTVAEKEIELGSVRITLPQPYEKWAGSIVADINGFLKGYKVRYQHIVLRHEAEEDKKPRPKSNRLRKPFAFQTSGRFLKTSKDVPHNTGQMVPGEGHIVDKWSLTMPDLKRKAWALYRSPAMLWMKDGRDGDWKKIREDFNYRPLGMLVYGGDFMLIWGTEATEDVSRGIPYYVDKSEAYGKTGSIFEIPKVDYLLGIGETNSVKNSVIVCRGIRIPKDGIARDIDWYEIKPIMIFSKDGVNFVEQARSGLLFGGVKIEAKSIAPNGKYKAFISSVRGIDGTSYSLSFVKAQDEIPERIVSLSEKCEIVWSANSQILAIIKDDKFIGYYDVKDDEIEGFFATSGRIQSKKDKVTDSDFDQKVRALLKLDK